MIKIGNITRRDFIKVSGLSIFIASTYGSLYACGGDDDGGSGKSYGYTFALRGDGKVVVIDEDSEKVIATIDLPEQGGTLGSITKDGKKLYVANNRGTTLSIIDAENFRRIKDLNTGTKPKHPIVSPDQKTVALNHQGLDNGKCRVVFIDVASDEIKKIVELPVNNTNFTGPFTMHGSWSPDSQLYMVGNYADNVAYVIDKDGSIRSTISLSGNPHYFDWVGREVWIIIENNENTGPRGNPQIAVYDISNPDNPQEIGMIDFQLVGGETGDAVEGHHGAFTNDGRYYYVCNRGGSPFEGRSINVIDRYTKQIVKTIQSPAKGAGHVYMDTVGKYAIVTQYGDTKIPIIDLSTQDVIKVLDAGGGGHMGHATFTWDSKKAFVSDRKGDRVIVIDMENLTIKNYISTGSGQAQGQVLNKYYNVFERVINPNLSS